MAASGSAESMDDFSEIPDVPSGATLATAVQLQSGPPMDPLKRIFTYEAAEWEQFVEEWVSTLKPAYQSVMRASGSNDRGIDVAGFTDGKKLEGVWDNYQCKHYGIGLGTAELFPEMGKILWHSFNKHYVAPRACYFVAPRNASTTASQLLANTTKLRREFAQAWDKSVARKITASQKITLSGDFLTYVNAFDFSIFRLIPVREILEAHKLTPHYATRFGGGLPPRPTPGAAPDDVGDHESVYVGQLLAAYSDHAKAAVPDIASLKKFGRLNDHFNRQREAFYHAEALRVFVRDKVAPGTFESLQDQVYHGVVDTCDAVHPDGYQRVVAVTQRSGTLALDAHPLSPSTQLQDRQGICHQLANDERLKWTE